MKNDLLNNKDFLENCKKATLEAFKNKINTKEVNELLKHMPNLTEDVLMNVSSGVLEAEASLVSALVWSKVKCYPKDQPWKFEASAWGPGVGGGSCIGFMYTAYTGSNAWDTFFKNVKAYHAQGIAATAGGFQITWFSSKGTPIGQFNGVLAGAGVFEIGGSGHWVRTK
ncbi:hypothetical protein ACFIJ5_10885 [Haloimpatiens sp. FM7330]|uniref:hypothetical protein n=1 Tax=Haloimpatiens sp. FM7330 TaxID=3298610 RepID=UPI00363EE14B